MFRSLPPRWHFFGSLALCTIFALPAIYFYQFRFRLLLANDDSDALIEARYKRKQVHDAIQLNHASTGNSVARGSILRKWQGASAAPSSVSIFYHIFVPYTKEGVKNALRIVREQVGQIEESYAAKSMADQGKNLTVYFTTLGNRTDIVNTRSLKKMLNATTKNIVFEQIHHASSGRETVTLQKVHDFCSRDDKAAAETVVYFHNKGSFHSNKYNENWRPLLTHAALNQCIQHGGPSDCNLCGLNFYTMWTAFVPGNVFAAKCSYVRKLIRPHHFQAKLELAVEQFALMRLTRNLVANLLPDRRDKFGWDRYSDEHWIGSHPDVIPCDCDPTLDMWTYTFRKRPAESLEWAMGPRAEKSPDPFQKERHVYNTQHLRLREYYLLPGNLVKWHALYGKAPSADSWAWTWFPDGKLWKEAVQKYGSVPKAVQQVTDSVLPLPRLVAPEPAFATEVKDKAFPPKLLSVFYDIFLPVNGSLQDDLDVIHNQLDRMTESPATWRAPIYFTTTGREVDDEVIAHDTSLNLQRLFAHRNEEKPLLGETLRHVHAYCQANTESSVVYVRNHVPSDPAAPEASAEDKRLRVDLATRAASSALCLMALEPGTCNVCGLQFNTLPALMMSGNMWIAECAYVNKLLSPVTYVERMRTVIAKLLVWRLWKQISHGLFKEATPYRMGLSGFAMEHWIASHPSLLPCHVASAENGTFWVEPPKSRVDLVEDGLNASALHTVYQSESLRMREGTFLAGNIYKWYSLYGGIPDNSSWAWSLFPDADTWLSWTKVHGNRTVQELTLRYGKEVKEEATIE